MRQRRWIELLSDYDYVIRYYAGKANVVADTLSRKNKEPIRVHNNLPKQIRNVQVEACKEEKLLLPKDFLGKGAFEVRFRWCLTCAKVKAEHQKPSGLLQHAENSPFGNGENTMDFISSF
ncbi:hypothetical protein Tco_1282247 [Tanacetum coccineum]